MYLELPKLLFIDDDLVTHDPGEFGAGACADWEGEYPENAVLGDMGYIHRELIRVFDVTIAASYDDALRQLETKKFDVVILDIFIQHDDDRYAGHTIAEQVYLVDNNLPIWILSQAPVERDVEVPTIIAYREKPYVARDIQAFVDEVQRTVR